LNTDFIFKKKVKREYFKKCRGEELIVGRVVKGPAWRAKHIQGLKWAGPLRPKAHLARPNKRRHIWSDGPAQQAFNLFLKKILKKING
jgi:hypothetical protein